MCLYFNRGIYAYAGGTLAHTHEGGGRIVRAGRTLDRFAVEAPIGWLKVAPDGRTVVLYNDRGTRLWRWRDGVGIERFRAASDHRDILGCGFVSVDGASITLVSQDGTLRALGARDRELFACNLRSPHSFAPRSFSQLPGHRLALAGSFFSDPCDVAITVGLDELSRNPEAVQQAIPADAPVWDRAIDIAVGPCEANAAVVLRDPEDTEVADDAADEDDERRDVENFAGVYIRELETGRLIERHPYTGRAGSGAPIAATEHWIAVQVVGGVDLIRRGSGEMRHVVAAILDVWGSQLAYIEHDELASVSSIDAIKMSATLPMF